METNLALNMAHLGAGLAIGFGAIGAGLGIGFATKGLMDAVSRQPEVAGKAFGFFLLGAALSEACALYAFVVAMQLLSK
ncbi:MAG: ATP synthase F0 subunit C [Fusobacterium sp.]|nr:ATP synthase F0 subunit C [Fusobacterium sp.]